MIIRKVYSRRLKREVWGFDGRFGGRRISRFDFHTKREAEEEVLRLRTEARRRKLGLLPETGTLESELRGILTRFESEPGQNPERLRLLNGLLELASGGGALPGEPEQKPPASLAELIPLRLQAIARPNEKTRAGRVLRGWAELLPPGRPIADLNTPDIRLYVEKRKGDGVGAASIDRELNIIAAALNSARDYFPELSQWRPPRIPRPKVSKSRRERIITDEEFRAICAELERPPDSRDGRRSHDQRSAWEARLRVARIFRWALATGMRPGEIYALRWQDIDREGGRVRVRGTKTDNVRYVPISEAVRAVLASMPEPKDKAEYVFTKGGGPAPKIYRILREAVEAAGIRYGRKEEGGFELYCARHTFTTRLLQSGLDLRTVGDITGHTDRELVLHYSHVTPASARAAVEALDKIAEKRSGGKAEEK